MTRTNRLVLAVVGTFVLAGAGTAFADYLWPLPFGNELTSIFGDYRTRRYHVGIDMRTGGEIGKTVVAPADGYVLRIRTGYYGYGKSINYKMADGNVAVFAHLSAFAPTIEEFIRGKQIAAESYNQDIELTADKFPFKRGETIGFSGATGVGAPHLHFEIRTADNVPLNPLTLPGLDVEDKIPPAFRNLRLVGFPNEELARALGWDLSHAFRKVPRDSAYTINVTLPCGLGDFWLAAEIVDKVGSSAVSKPIYEVEVRCLDRVLYHLRYDRVSFEETYLIDAQRNFEMAQTGNQEYYNLVDVATCRKMAGLCELVGQDPPPIQIIARDVAGNTARATLRLFDATHTSKDGRFAVPRPDTSALNRLLSSYGDRYGANRSALIPSGKKLLLLARIESAKSARVMIRNQHAGLESQAQQVIGRYYLGVADSFDSPDVADTETGADTVFVLIEPAVGEVSSFAVPNEYTKIKRESGQSTRLASVDGRFSVDLPAGDDLLFPLDGNYFVKLNQPGVGRYPSYSISPSNFPLIKQVTYNYSLGDNIPKGVGLYSVGGKGLFYLGGTIDSLNKSISAKSYVLATITARQDTVPPSVRQLRPAGGALVGSVRPTVAFAFSDDLSGVRDDIDIRIDGKWCIPVFDPESGQVTSIPHFDLGGGKHKLEIRVRDKAGNLRSISTEFRRSGK